MVFHTIFSGFPTKPLCYLEVAGTDGRAPPGNIRKPNAVGVYAVCGSRWSDISKTRLRAAEDLWVYEVVLRGGADTRFTLANAVAARQIFRVVTITFHSRAIIDDYPGTRVIIEAGTDTFKDVVFFEKDHPKAGLPFERFYFAGTADRNHRPRIQTVSR